MICHLSIFFGMGFVGPLVIWLIKKDEFPLVDDAGRQALDFQITMFILFIPGMICVPAGTLTGVLIYYLAWILASLVFPVIAAVRVKQGVFYRFPICVHVFGITR